MTPNPGIRRRPRERHAGQENRVAAEVDCENGSVEIRGTGMIRREQQEAFLRAVELGRATLKIGDKISSKVCGGGRTNFVIARFQGNHIYSKTGVCTTAASIVTVNGACMSFYQEPKE